MKPWLDGKPGDWAWLCHHGILIEMLTEPSSNRVDYINTDKPEHERAVRLEWFRPVKDPSRIPESVAKARAELHKALGAHWDELVSLHKEEYPGCPFDYERRTLVFGDK